MPISQNIRTLVAIPVAVFILSLVLHRTILVPDNLKGTTDIVPVIKTIPIPVDGPESLEFDPQGEGPYASVVDGRVLKWRGDDLGWVDFAYTSRHRGNCSKYDVVPTCGRPLGLKFDKRTGDLYICDGYLGLMKVGPQGGLAELLVDSAEGQKVMFANQGDLDEEEDVFYFVDTSDKYHFRDIFFAASNGQATGRVIRYDLKTKETKVVMKDLFANNGLALNKDRSFLITCESMTGYIHRYWIKGPKAGTRDVFAKVPAYLDNIRLTPSGDFWFGVHNKESPAGRFLVRNKWLGKIVEKTVRLDLLVAFFGGFTKPGGIAMKLNGETGEIIEILEDKEGKKMRYVSEAYEREDGKVWFGAVFGTSVWVLDRK